MRAVAQSKQQRAWLAEARRKALLAGPMDCRRCVGTMLIDDSVVDGIGWSCLLCGRTVFIAMPAEPLPSAGRQPAGRPVDPLRAAVARDMIRDGFSHLEVVRKLHLSRQAVSMITRELEQEECA